MAYIDAQGYRHLSLDEAKSGYVAKTTADRDATGKVVGNSQGSNYVRSQEKKVQTQNSNNAYGLSTQEKQVAQQQTPVYSQTYLQQNARLQEQIKAVRPNTTGSITIDTSEETVRRAQAQGLNVSLDRSSGKMVINASGENAQANIEATKAKLEAIHKQTYAEEAEKWKGALTQKTIQVRQESLSDKAASALGVKSQLDSVNKFGSKYVPTLETIQEKRDIALEKVGLLDERQKVTEAIRSNSLTAGFQDWSVHGYQGLKETPVSFAAEQGAEVAIAYAGGAVVKGAGIAGRVGLEKVGLSKLAGAVEPVINVGLGAATVYEASKVKTVEGGVDFVSDFALMGVGYKAGSKAGLKTYDRLRTIGSEKVLPESLIKTDVLSGKEQFPLTKEGANAQDVLNSFKDPTTGEFIGYHATTGKVRPEVGSDVKRPTDVPGLYVAPVQGGASPHFLRLSGEESSATTTLLEGIKTLNVGKIKSGLIGTSDPISPNVIKLSINEVGRLPENARYSPEKAQTFLLSPEAPKGNAFLTPILEQKVGRGVRAEAEAIVVPETKLQETTLNKKYFEWNDRRVEIKEYKTAETNSLLINGELKGELSSKASKELITAGELTKTYRVEPPGSRGLISEIAYPVLYTPKANYQPYTPSVIYQASLPGEGSRASILNIDSRASISNIDSRANISNIDSRANIPNIDSRANIPNIDSRSIDDRIIDSRSIDGKETDNHIIDNHIIDNQIEDTGEISIDFEIPDPLTRKHKLIKPKQKMLKNVYGDPFSGKTKL